jgi:hypothetical protein
VLDKILSENINLEFFGNDIARTEEILRRGGGVETRAKGSLRLLEEWLRARFHPKGGDPIKQMFDPLKEVRKARQKPAHALQPDAFDRAIFREQHDLIVAVYNSLLGLRIVFQRHPACVDYEVEEFLDSDKIRTF